MADEIYRHWLALFNVIGLWISFACEFNFNITSPEIFAKYIDKLQNNKAVGYDGLKATFIKSIRPSVMQLSLRAI